MRGAKRNWGFERLECRALLTGTVRAIEYSAPSPTPTLLIRGDSGDNSIVIHETKSSYGVISVKLEGIGTKIVSGLSFESGPIATHTGMSTVLNAVDILIDLGGGNDTLRIYDTTVPGTLLIKMGAGNDTLRMKNVQFNPLHEFPLYVSGFSETPVPAISLGTGNDLANLINVVSTGDIHTDAGLGQDTVKLSRVTAGHFGSDNILSVNMGPGNFDRLRVSASTADHSMFTDADGKNGTLIHADYNYFGAETDIGFKTMRSITTGPSGIGFEGP